LWWVSDLGPYISPLVALIFYIRKANFRQNSIFPFNFPLLNLIKTRRAILL